jgi:glycosyltransferase involved in cell wall biosynthesis
LDEPLVSVNVSVYNHEAYIERCLRSIASQKVDFPYEVFVGEDCSTDGTRALLKEMAKELPPHFKFLFRERNMGGEANDADMLFRSRGTYLAILEGDDFWTEDTKLQTQVDFLRSHPEYSAVFHRCVIVGKDSLPTGEKYPECPCEEYTFKEYFYCSMPGQIGTSLIRREPYVAARKRFTERSCYQRYAGDRRYAFILLSIGKVKSLPSVWSAYRHVLTGGSSYSATVRIDEEYARNEVQFGRTLVSYAEDCGNPEALRAAKLTYYRTYLKWSHGRIAPFSRKDCMRELMGERDWPAYLFSPIRWSAVLVMRSLLGRGVTL